MPKPKHPYYDAILDVLSDLDNVRSRSIFGHQGYAFGSSVFAFLDEDRLIIRSERYPEGTPMPSGISYFRPDIFSNRVWIGIEFDDSLRTLTRYRSLIEESYRTAVGREETKQIDKRQKESSSRQADHARR